MASLNRCTFIGNITRSPELRTTNSGTEVVSFSIAVNEKYKDKETTEFIDVTAWSKLASIIAQYCTKGQLVYVEGRYTTDKFTDKDGNERKAVKIVADKFLMLGGKGSAKPADADEPPQFDDESIPF